MPLAPTIGGKGTEMSATLRSAHSAALARRCAGENAPGGIRWARAHGEEINQVLFGAREPGENAPGGILFSRSARKELYGAAEWVPIARFRKSQAVPACDLLVFTGFSVEKTGLYPRLLRFP